MAERRRGLGRGLGALIPSAPQESESTAAATAPVTTDEPAAEAATVVPPSPGPTEPASADASDSAQVPSHTPPSPAPAIDVDVDDERPAVGSPQESPIEDESPQSTPVTAVDSAPAAESPTGSTPGRADSAARPPRSPGRAKRPVDVFFDGAPKQREHAAAVQDDASTDEPASASKTGRSSGSKERRGRRAVSAEAMESALARGSRGGRSLGSRSAVSDEGDSDAREREADPHESERTETGLSTDVDDAGEGMRYAEDQVSRETLVEVPGAVFAEIPVVEIQPNSRQPRSVFDEDEMGELVHSIRTIGVLQPIVVRRRPAGGGYELVMGERRWRATQRAGLETIPAIVRTTEDTDMLRDALLENLHRSQLNPLEEAAAYQQLLDDFAATHDELAVRIGRSRPQISNTLRLLQLPPLVQRRVAAGVLSAGHARALLSLADAGEIEKLAQRIVSEGLSVRATEEAVALSDGLKRSSRNASPRNSVRHERLDYLANSLSDYLDTSVKVSLGARKGKVSIEFGSVEDLNRIIDLISPDARQ